MTAIPRFAESDAAFEAGRADALASLSGDDCDSSFWGPEHTGAYAAGWDTGAAQRAAAVRSSLTVVPGGGA